MAPAREEPQALQTAALGARVSGLPLVGWPGLHEHDRWNVRWLERDRFEGAVAEPGQNPAGVTHGTVIALFPSGVPGLGPLPLRQRLGLPAFVALSWREGRVLSVPESLWPPEAGKGLRSTAANWGHCAFGRHVDSVGR